MPNRHRPHGDVPDGHRTEMRRDEDVVAYGVAERVLGEPVTRSLLSMGKLVTAVMVITTFGASVMGAMGGRWISSRQETARLDAKIDSMSTRATAERKVIEGAQQQLAVHLARTDSILIARGEDMEMSSFVNCLLVRRLAPDLRPKGCDAAERRGASR